MYNMDFLYTYPLFRYLMASKDSVIVSDNKN